MSEKAIYSKVAVEILELMKYFDQKLKDSIPQDFEEKLNRIKSDTYSFKIDTSKSLEEQSLLPETQKVLIALYVQYCCTPEEKLELYNYKKQQIEAMQPKTNSFELKSEGVEEATVTTQLVDNTKLPWYKKIFLKFKNLFSK